MFIYVFSKTRRISYLYVCIIVICNSNLGIISFPRAKKFNGLSWINMNVEGSVHNSAVKIVIAFDVRLLLIHQAVLLPQKIDRWCEVNCPISSGNRLVRYSPQEVFFLALPPVCPTDAYASVEILV